MANLGSLVTTFSANMHPLDTAVTHAETTFRRFQRRSTTVFDTIKHSVFSLRNSLMLLAGSTGLGLVARSMIQITNKFKQYKLTLQALIGNNMQANKTWSTLLKFAEQTPYTIGDVMGAYKMMLAYGLKPTVSTMRALGDTAAAVGKDALPRLAYALGQIGAASKIRMQDLMQLQNAGINTRQALLSAFGTGDLTALNKQITNGTINMQQVVQAFVNYMHTHFGGMMKKQMQTLSGQFEILKSYWQEFENAVMTSGLYDFLVQQLKKINSWIEKLKKTGRFQKYANDVANTTAHLAGHILIAIAKVTRGVEDVYNWIKAHKTVSEIGLIGYILLGRKGKLAAGALAGIYALDKKHIKPLLDDIGKHIEDFEKSGGFTGDIKDIRIHFGSSAPELEKTQKTTVVVAKNAKVIQAAVAAIVKDIRKADGNTDGVLDAIEKAGKALLKFEANSKGGVTGTGTAKDQIKVIQDRLKAERAATKKEDIAATAEIEKIKARLAKEKKIKSKATQEASDEIIRIEKGPFAYYKQKLNEQMVYLKKHYVAKAIRDRYYNDELEEYLKEHTKKTATFMQEAWANVSKAMENAFSTYFVDAMEGHLHKLTDYIIGFLNTIRNAMAQFLGQKIGSTIIGAIGGALGNIVAPGAATTSITPSATPIYTAANGGIFKNGFKAFASGGIVNQPTLGLVGEGRYNEAVVPLPDGRSIPVKGAAPNIEINVVNKGQPVNAKQSDMHFDGRKWVVDVVLNAMQTEPTFRNAIRSA